MAAPNPTVEIVVEHAASSIGEGPHWDDKDNKLLYVDILDNNVHRLDVETKEQDTATLGESWSLMVMLSQVPLPCMSEEGLIMYCDAEQSVSTIEVSLGILGITTVGLPVAVQKLLSQARK